MCVLAAMREEMTSSATISDSSCSFISVSERVRFQFSATGKFSLSTVRANLFLEHLYARIHENLKGSHFGKRNRA